MTQRLFTACAASLVLLASAGAGFAQDAAADRADQLLGATPGTDPEAGKPSADGEAYYRAPDDRQDAGELRTTQALNAETVARDERIAAGEQALRDAYEAERARHEVTTTRLLQERLAYEEDLRRSEAEAAAAQRRYEQDMARWQADVRACQAGNRARCAPPR